MISRGDWRPVGSGASLRRWFLFRDGFWGDPRYHEDSHGHLIRYASHETAQRVADRLNRSEAVS